MRAVVEAVKAYPASVLDAYRTLESVARFPPPTNPVRHAEHIVWQSAAVTLAATRLRRS